MDLSGAESVPEWAVRDLYRIALEATANALRHAGAKRITIRLVVVDSDVALEIEDDGVGFDPATSPLGSGVQGMRERAAVLGGDLEIERGAMGGTRVRFLLRLLQPNAGGAAGPGSAAPLGNLGSRRTTLRRGMRPTASRWASASSSSPSPAPRRRPCIAPPRP
jgi:hypothetical protein